VAAFAAIMHAILVGLAVALIAPSIRNREPSWPMAVEATDTRARSPVRVAREAPARVLERADPEDRSMVAATQGPRIVEAPGPGWPSASIDPGPRM
jgi:hypothetical protein